MSMVQIELTDDFNPATEGIMLRSEAKKLTAESYSGEGTIQLTSYAPNNLEYTATVKGKQLAVFSEIYYKDGWTATVDGKEQEIIKVNYLLRGLELPNGEHKIVFHFDLPSLRKSNMYAIAGTCLLGLFICFGLWKFRKEDQKGGETKSGDAAQ